AILPQCVKQLACQGLWRIAGLHSESDNTCAGIAQAESSYHRGKCVGIGTLNRAAVVPTHHQVCHLTADPIPNWEEGGRESDCCVPLGENHVGKIPVVSQEGLDLLPSSHLFR